VPTLQDELKYCADCYLLSGNEISKLSWKSGFNQIGGGTIFVSTKNGDHWMRLDEDSINMIEEGMKRFKHAYGIA